jgi:hypothetical protein
MNLTTAQTNALQTVADNTNVIAITRGIAGYITINGNTENKLQALGLIEKHAVGTMARLGGEITISVWVLTAAGRTALGLDEVTEVEVTETPAETVEVAQATTVEIADAIATEAAERVANGTVTIGWVQERKARRSTAQGRERASGKGRPWAAGRLTLPEW